MSRILLFHTPNSKLPTLGSILLRRGYQVAVLLHVVGQHSSQEPPSSDLTYIGLADVDLADVDLTIVDVSCGLDGTSYCQALFQAYPRVPLMLLVSEDAPISAECHRLTCGNVLRLPFTTRKIVNRVARLIESEHVGLLQVGEVTLNPVTNCVLRGDTVRRLTPKQAKLLQVFMEHSGQTLTRKFLMETVWQTDYMGDTRTLDVHVRWIRERIEEEPSHPQYLRTVRGIGYRFAAPSEE